MTDKHEADFKEALALLFDRVRELPVRIRDLERQLAEARQELFEAGKLTGKAHKALEEIRTWCEAYPTPIFTPLTDDDLRVASDGLKTLGIDIGALHAQWARHLLDGIGKIAREALDE
jgi:hypothetical protein